MVNPLIDDVVNHAWENLFVQTFSQYPVQTLPESFDAVQW